MRQAIHVGAACDKRSSSMKALRASPSVKRFVMYRKGKEYRFPKSCGAVMSASRRRGPDPAVVHFDPAAGPDAEFLARKQS